LEGSPNVSSRIGASYLIEFGDNQFDPIIDARSDWAASRWAREQIKARARFERSSTDD
jgi:hypothetical protein